MGTHLGDLDLGHEAHSQVLVDDAVRGGEEGEDVADEVPLIVVQCLPVLHIVAKVDLLGCNGKWTGSGREVERKGRGIRRGWVGGGRERRPEAQACGRRARQRHLGARGGGGMGAATGRPAASRAS
jgi:hypothetical protein